VAAATPSSTAAVFAAGNEASGAAQAAFARADDVTQTNGEADGRPLGEAARQASPSEG